MMENTGNAEAPKSSRGNDGGPDNAERNRYNPRGEEIAVITITGVETTITTTLEDKEQVALRAVIRRLRDTFMSNTFLGERNPEKVYQNNEAN